LSVHHSRHCYGFILLMYGSQTLRFGFLPIERSVQQETVLHHIHISLNFVVG